MRPIDCKLCFRGRQIRIWTVALFGVMLLGCGGRDYRLVEVSGTVTIDSQPLAGASVTFVPIGDGVGPASTAVTDDRGHYRLQTIDLDLSGAVPGFHRVTITTARADAADERATISKEQVPAEYRDGSFRLEVGADDTPSVDIEISTKSKRR